MYRTILLIISMIFMGGGVFGQNVYTYDDTEQGHNIFIDYAQFRSDNDSLVRLEIYYKVLNSSLIFVRDSGDFKADYEVTAAVSDKKGRPIVSDRRDRESVVQRYMRTLSEDDYRIGQFDFELEPGKYEVKVNFTDFNADRTAQKTIKVELPDYDSRNPMISGILFVHDVDPLGADSTFAKGSQSVIPDVDRVYGGDTSAAVTLYYEIYPGRNDLKEVTTETRFLDRKKNQVYKDIDTVVIDRDVIRRTAGIALKGLKSGSYEVEIELKGNFDRGIDKVKGLFAVQWSPEAMVLNDYETAAAQLKYIATSDEMDALKKADSPEEQIEVWRKFWKDRDPTPGTAVNEAEQGYYRRIEFANRNFSIMRKEGWRTDRGMIFIIYGEPDQIEDYPFEIGGKAYQVWHYYHSVDKVREFVFLDEWGNGDYVLQYPYDGITY